MNRRFIRKSICFFLVLILILGGISMDIKAKAPKGIGNNGLCGITIDINAAPYTTLAAVPDWGQYAYTNEGCAWFASSRVRQLTGDSCTIFSGPSWYNIQYANFGYSRGSVIRSRALACYQYHVAVVECFNSDGTVTVSEGGYSKAGSAYGYTAIHKMSIAEVQSNKHGAFLGYVYLPGSSTAPAGKFTANTSKISYETGEQEVLNWSTSANAVMYKVTITRVEDSQTIYNQNVSGTSWAGSLPIGTYHYSIAAYNDTNTQGASQTGTFTVNLKGMNRVRIENIQFPNWMKTQIVSFLAYFTY